MENITLTSNCPLQIERHDLAMISVIPIILQLNKREIASAVSYLLEGIVIADRDAGGRAARGLHHQHTCPRSSALCSELKRVITDQRIVCRPICGFGDGNRLAWIKPALLTWWAKRITPNTSPDSDAVRVELVNYKESTGFSIRAG